MDDLFKRIGTFEITNELIRENPNFIMERIMSKMVIVRAEQIWESNSIRYTAISELFEPKRDGELTRIYTFRLENDTLIVE